MNPVPDQSSSISLDQAMPTQDALTTQDLAIDSTVSSDQVILPTDYLSTLDLSLESTVDSLIQPTELASSIDTSTDSITDQSTIDYSATDLVLETETQTTDESPTQTFDDSTTDYATETESSVSTEFIDSPVQSDDSLLPTTTEEFVLFTPTTTSVDGLSIAVVDMLTVSPVDPTLTSIEFVHVKTKKHAKKTKTAKVNQPKPTHAKKTKAVKTKAVKATRTKKVKPTKDACFTKTVYITESAQCNATPLAMNPQNAALKVQGDSLAASQPQPMIEQPSQEPNMALILGILVPLLFLAGLGMLIWMRKKMLARQVKKPWKQLECEDVKDVQGNVLTDNSQRQVLGGL